MSTVYIAQPHSMAWCLDCHRHPRIICGRTIRRSNLDRKPEDVKRRKFVAKDGQPSDPRGRFFKKKQLTESEIGQTLKERWKYYSANKLPGVPQMTRKFTTCLRA